MTDRTAFPRTSQVTVLAGALAVAELLSSALGLELSGLGFQGVISPCATDAVNRLGPSVGEILLVDVSCAAGRQALPRLAAEQSDARLGLLFVDSDFRACQVAIRSGVVGLFSRHATVPEIAHGVMRICAGSRFCSEDLIDGLLGGMSASGNLFRLSGNTTRQLTRRDVQVSELVAAGMTNREIADELVLQPQTVKNYVHRLFQKFGVRNRVAFAAAWRSSQAITRTQQSRDLSSD